MRISNQLLLFLAVLGVLPPVAAETYKWVDERGVTNYSNAPPAAAPAGKLTRVDNTLSVYTPDDNFMQAVKALRERSLKALSEPEPQPQRAPVTRVSTAQSGYEQCLMSGRLGCDDLYGNHYPVYLPGVAAVPLRGITSLSFPSPRPPASRPDPTRISRVPPLR